VEESIAQLEKQIKKKQLEVDEKKEEREELILRWAMCIYRLPCIALLTLHNGWVIVVMQEDEDF